MTYLLILLLLGVNFAISWSNAKAVGRYWSESKQVGGSFRAEIMCGYIQAIFGFTMAYGYVLMLIAPAFMQAKGVNPELIADFEILTSNMVYLLVAVPIVGSGFRIWFSSLRAAWEQRSLRTIATAGWNSYAQIQAGIPMHRSIIQLVLRGTLRPPSKPSAVSLVAARNVAPARTMALLLCSPYS